MNIYKRMQELQKLFSYLATTSGRNDKEGYVYKFRKDFPELSKDLDYCFEVLDGRHKLGYPLAIFDDPKAQTLDISNTAWSSLNEEAKTLEDFCKFLCVENCNAKSLHETCQFYKGFGWFLNPLFNRQWRLGIGKSQLQLTNESPMLAKKFDPDNSPYDPEGYYLTEKLDGNRCGATFHEEDGKWHFKSRSGKEMSVNFFLGNLPKSLPFDGEILSIDQIEHPSQANFNALSGTINSSSKNKKGLIYKIFDIKDDLLPYKSRREILDRFAVDFESPNVVILPTLAHCTQIELAFMVDKFLNEITAKGGEGVMINLASRCYEHKRTDSLLKCKRTYTMDMSVEDINPGTGKNAGLVGSLVCWARGDGKSYECQVGSGLNDQQRSEWADHPERIIGHIVEVAYFSVSQDAQERGTNNYSLRFPRLKRVRDDKSETSIY